MNKLLLLLGIFVVPACGSDQKQAPPAPAAAEQPPPESGGEQMTSDHPGPVSAPPDGGAYSFEACVKECVRNHQMEAIPVEKIEANCQGECTSSK